MKTYLVREVALEGGVKIRARSPFGAAQSYADRVFSERRAEGIHVLRIAGTINMSGVFQAHTAAGEVLGAGVEVLEANE